MFAKSLRVDSRLASSSGLRPRHPTSGPNLTPAASACAFDVVRFRVGGEVEVGLAPDFNFNLNENKLWALCILYLCILRHSFSLFASVMLRDFRVYLKIQMDGRPDVYVTVDAVHRHIYNCRVYTCRECTARSRGCLSLNECQLVCGLWLIWRSLGLVLISSYDIHSIYLSLICLKSFDDLLSDFPYTEDSMISQVVQ